MPELYYVYETPKGDANYGFFLPDACRTIGMAATKEGAQMIAAMWNEQAR